MKNINLMRFLHEKLSGCCKTNKIFQTALITAVMFAVIFVSCAPKEREATNRNLGSLEGISFDLGEIDYTSAVITDAPLRKIPDDAPRFVRDAAEKAPKDALIGIGSARLTSLSVSRTAAATRARADISRQLESTVEYSQDGTVTVITSSANLTGVVTIEEDVDDEGIFWVVVMMNTGNEDKD